MKVAVWGAGQVAMPLVYRLATLPTVSEIFWINRTLDKIRRRRIDIEHGLAFAPSCRRVQVLTQDDFPAVAGRIELLILTQGATPQEGQSRADVYPESVATFSESVLPRMGGFGGVVLVISNPVDLMARLVAINSGLPPQRVIGLGTVVETARLRAAMAPLLSPPPPARTLDVFAIGTHDKHFIPVTHTDHRLTTELRDTDLRSLTECKRIEVVRAATRVKKDGGSTVHPIVEGAVAVLEAVATDSHAMLTVSCLDPNTEDRLFYSMPCTIGRDGVVHRHTGLLRDQTVLDGIAGCVGALRATIEKYPDAPPPVA